MKLKYGGYEIDMASVVVRTQPVSDDRRKHIGHVETWTVVARPK